MSDSEQVLKIIADNLKGTLEKKEGCDSIGNQWKQYIITYDKKKKLDKASQISYNKNSFAINMNIQVIQLVSGDHILADVEQLEEEPNCYLKDAYLIKEDGTLVELSLIHI